MIKLRVTEILQIFGLFLALFAICIAITINFHPLYYFMVTKENLGEKAGVSNAHLIKSYKDLLNFLNFPWITELHMKLPTSYAAMQHYRDVKALFLKDYVVATMGILYSYWYLKKLRIQKCMWILIQPIYYLIIMIVLVLFAMLINFNNFFIVFHKILFRNNDWLFDPNLDPIINALPESYFMACFILFLSLFFACLIGLLMCGKNELKKK